MKNRDNQQELPHATKIKKSYQQPQLQVYGDLRNITQAVGNMGGSDGGTPPMHKTH